MSQIWNFLIENRDTLTWLGGGLIVVGGGLWAAVQFFFGRNQGRCDPVGHQPASFAISANSGGHIETHDIRYDTRTGTPPGLLLLLVHAFLGAQLIAINLSVNAVTGAHNSTVAGEDVIDSDIRNQQ